MLFAMCL